MRIVVCLRYGIDTAELRPHRSTRAPRLDRIQWRVGPFSENALEEAVRLEGRFGGDVRVLSLVEEEPPRELQLRVLAMGADEATLVMVPGAETLDALGVATLLAAALRRLEPFDVLLFGDAAADRYERQVGPRVAQELHLPSVTRAVGLDVDGDRLVVRRSLEDGAEVVDAPMPAVVTVLPEINDPRLPAMLQLLNAGHKPTHRLDRAGVGAVDEACAGGTEQLELSAPPSARRRERIEGASHAEVARKLARKLAVEGLLG